MFMKNVGGFDRFARIIVGIALIILSYTGYIGTWGYIGIIPLITGLFSRCPLYALIGLNTCPLSRK